MYFARYAQDYYDGPMMHDGYGWLSLLMMLLIWGAIIGLVIYAIRAFTQHRSTGSGHRDPLDIARERYAKGEISKEELADIRKELK